MKYIKWFAVWLIATSAWAGDIEKGKEASKLCQACHMENGSGKDNGQAESWPRLAGLSEVYFIKQLQDIKSGKRFAPSMNAFVKMLDDQQIADLASYYASLPVPENTWEVKATPEQLQLGEKLAVRGDWNRYLPPCASCHGVNNEGVGDVFPPLAGQPAGYIAKQLQLWKTDQRQNDTNQLMISIAKRLTDEDIQAVSAWLASQKLTGEKK